MKKLLLSIAVLGVMTFVACSEEEKDYTPNYVLCQHCDIAEEEGYEVCVDDSGNAFVGNADTGIPLGQYYSLFCDNTPEIPGTPGAVYTDCVMCVSDAHPEGQKVCKGSNNNAFTFVGNAATDTQIPYTEYLAANCTTATPIPVEVTDCVDCTVGPVTTEVCKGENGNAYSEGVDLGAPYSQYITALEAGGGNCN